MTTDTISPITVPDTYECTSTPHGGFAGLDRDALQHLISSVKTIDYDKIRAIYGTSSEVCQQIHHFAFKDTVLPQVLINRNTLLYRPISDEKVSRSTPTARVVVNPSRTEPWSIIYAFKRYKSLTNSKFIFEKPHALVPSFMETNPQPPMKSFRVNLINPTLRKRERKRNSMFNKVHDLSISISLKNDGSKTFVRSMWDHSSLYKRARTFGHHDNGFRDANEEQFYGIIKEEYYKPKLDGKDIPNEFIIPLVEDHPLHSFSILTICLSNDELKADVIITPIYSTPLTYQ
jgi:hypothetical protein